MATISGHELTLSQDCATPGCVGEADASGLCRSCRQPTRNGKGNVRFEKTGLVVDGELEDDELLGLVRRLGRMETAIKWWLGDALVLADSRWPDQGGPSFGEWDNVLAALGLKPATGAHYRRVSKAIPIERRHERLSWSHHQRVVPFPPAEQDLWLERAEREGMSFEALHFALTNLTLSPTRTTSVSDLDCVKPRLIASAESIARWKEAAAERGCTLGALAVEALELLTAPP
jgi:hypothetical protein